MTGDAVVVEGLTKVFNRHLVAVDHVNFTVGAGEIFGFLGPNGAGKTTTINMLTTLLKPTAGTATVAGYDILTQPTQVRRSIGLVPQELTVDDELTGWENMLLQSRLYHVPADEARHRARLLLELVGLTDAANRLVRTYSGGMRKRLELVEGFLHYPDVLFLDEPTLGLDVQTRTVMWNYITQLAREHHLTIFLTTHYMEEADNLCHRVAIIDHGKVIALGPPHDLKDRLGGDIIEIRVRHNSETLSSLLQSLHLVQEVKSDGAALRLKVRRGEEALPRILEACTRAEQEVLTVALTKPTLDQVYLEYTGRSLRDAQEGAEDARRTVLMRRRLQR